MTLDEANALGAVVQWADGGCSTCVENLVMRLNERFPDFVWQSRENGPEPEDYDFDGSWPRMLVTAAVSHSPPSG